MVVSLYVCEIPKNISKQDLENLFSELEGYIETRIKGTNDKRKIAFIDFEAEKEAKFALETLQGFKFSSEDKGIIIKISDNTKEGHMQNKKHENKMLNRKRRSNSNERNPKRDNNRYSPHSHHTTSNSNSNKSYNKEEEKISQSTSMNNPSNSSTPNDLINLINILTSGVNNPTPPSNKNTNLIQNHPISTNNPYTLHENTPDLNQSNYLNPDLNQNNQTNSLNNLIEIIQNIQTAQLLNSLTGGSSTGVIPNQIDSNISNLPTNSKSNKLQSSSIPSHNESKFLSSYLNFEENFKKMTEYKRGATNIVYVEGLPLNTTEREVAHIFRPFQGFKSVRLITREKNGEKSVICFADFEDINQSTICINTLQGYRFDKEDLLGLHFSYGVSKYKNKK
jgi:RNA recognition motif-containing protein